MNNPSLTQVPRSQGAPIIPVQRESSILKWLEDTGRLIAREVQDYDYRDNEEEIADLMASDESGYELDDDEEDMLDPEE